MEGVACNQISWSNRNIKFVFNLVLQRFSFSTIFGYFSCDFRFRSYIHLFANFFLDINFWVCAFMVQVLFSFIVIWVTILHFNFRAYSWHYLFLLLLVRWFFSFREHVWPRGVQCACSGAWKIGEQLRLFDSCRRRRSAEHCAPPSARAGRAAHRSGGFFFFIFFKN